MAMVNVRVKSRISNQESSVDEDEMRLERRDTMDARDPAGVLPLLLLSQCFSLSGVTKRLQSLEGEVTEFITPPRKRPASQKKRYSQTMMAETEMETGTTTTSPPGGKGLPRQECIDLVVAGQPHVVAKRNSPTEEIEVDHSEDIDDDRCSGSTRELNDDIEEVASVSPTCFVTEFGQTEVHFEASDPVDDIGDSL